MTNVVTPSLTIAATEIWFDPTGASKQPVQVRLSLTQSDKGAAEYLGGGTLRRSQENLELFLDEACTKPLTFSENQARVTNAELQHDNGSGKPAGLMAWVLATGPSQVGVNPTLTLALDRLETSERKQTNFDTGAKTNRINVDDTAPSATAELEVKKATVVTPTMTVGTLTDPDRRVWLDPPLTPLVLALQTQPGDGSVSYDGDGELELDPPNAAIALFADALATQPVTITSGKATISNATLTTPDTLWLRATGEAAPARVVLRLRLRAASAPAKVRVAGPVTQEVWVARPNVVTPKLTVALDPALDGMLWFPPLSRVPTPSIAIGVTQTRKSETPYTGSARLTRSSSALRLFRDEALTEPVPFFDDHAVLDNAAITGDEPLRLYLAGAERSDAKLTLSLYDPKQRAWTVGAAVEQTIAVRPVNVVTPRVEYDGTVGPGRLTRVKLFAAQTNAADAPYDKGGQLTRSDARLLLFGDQQDGQGTEPVFSGSETTASLSNREVVATDEVWLASWTGDELPGDEVTLGLSLPSSSRAYVITNPSGQLRALPELEPPPVPLGGTNVVTPKIETEYDLVLRATVETDPKLRTTPVRARLHVAQSNPKVPYQGDGQLWRSGPGIRVFLDEACTVELGWNGSQQAMIPNAWLVDPTRIYWLQGAAAGKHTLTLSAAVPADGAPPPAITVAEPATKELAVVALSLQMFRDDGGRSVMTSVPMTPLEQRTRGRFVPVQNPVKNDLGRAKLVIAKVATGDWPGAAARHVVRLSVISDQDTVDVFDAETSGSVVASKTTALTLDQATAGSKDTVLWVQGKAASAELRDVRIDLGLDRTDGAGWDDRKPLLGGDLALVTSVRITRVTPDAADWKQFVNQPPDRTLTTNDDQAEAANGRGILVTATVEPAKAGIGVDFVLWGFDGNGDATGSAPRVPRIPVTLRASADHVPAVTNAAGRASARLTLSRFGGDRFFAVAFLADDALKGMAELGKKGADAPASTKSKPIEVWQKIFYTLAVMKRWNTGDYGGRANEPTFRAKYEVSFLALERKGSVKVVPHQTVLDDNAAVDSWWKANNLPDPTERTFDLVLVDSLADPPNDTTIRISAPSSTDAAIGLQGTYDLGSKPAWLRSGTGKIKKLSDGSLVANVPDDRISLTFFGPADYRLRVDLSGLLPSGVSPSDVVVKVTLREQDTFSGFSSGPKTFVAMRLREQDASSTYDPTESANHTMWHEAGHYLGLTAKKVPDDAGTLNVFWYEGWPGPARTTYNRPEPPPPTLVTRQINSQIGQGPHCHYSSQAFNAVQLATDGWIAPGQTPECIMFHALSTPITTNYCDDCEKALRARDLSSPSVDGSADF